MTVPKTLIDGYNLLFQSPLVGRGRGRNWLPNARGRLAHLLLGHLSPEELQTTLIVFDAPHVGRSPQPEQHSSGLQIIFAVDHAEADDMLEDIIRRHPTPKLLTVVSSDVRIRRCARARKAKSVDADQFLEQLERRPERSTGEAPTLSQVDDTATSAELDSEGQIDPRLSQSEVDYWLREFGQ
jgi:predicted RNA-binding protein with PIN domain